MAFDRSNIVAVSYGAGRSVWFYDTSDTLAVVGADQYFQSMRSFMSEGSIIYTRAVDGYRTLRVTGVQPNLTTITEGGATGTMATQNASAVAITGGTWNGGSIGATTPATATYSASFRSSATAAQTLIGFGAGALDGPTKDGIWTRHRYTGTITDDEGATADGKIALNKILITDETKSATDTVNGVLVMHLAGNGGTTTDSGRTAFQSRMIAGSRIGASSDAVALVSAEANAYAQVTQGGAGGWTPGTNPDPPVFRGSLFGGNDNARLVGSATNFRMVCGREIDVCLSGSASAWNRYGMIVVDAASTKQAIGDDAGIAILGDGVGLGFKCALQFGALASSFPIDATGTLIGAVPQTYPVPATPSCAYGVDFSGVTFTGSAFKSIGFSVSGAGAVSSRPAASATPAANGDMVFELTSNTSLKIKVKGSDGVVRSATLTLA